MPQARSFTVRLPDAVYRAARRFARLEGVSLNRLVAEVLRERARRVTTRRLRDAYDALGRDAAESEVESLAPLQAESHLDD